jgi:hypothetical protein
MNVYRYIAESNSDAAYILCQSKGINEIYSIDDLESALELLVAQGDEYAMKVFNLHPDKDMLIEAFGKKEETAPIEIKKQEVIVVDEKPTTCSCKLNATGDETQQQKNNSIVTQTNTYILLGALIVSMAIISIKK